MTEPLSELVSRSRRIGADQGLVVHGGGNTSAKGSVMDSSGSLVEVMWIKGSGTDRAGSDESDFPMLDLVSLTALRAQASMTDDEMLDRVSRAVRDPRARRPSIETLLHAFLPFRHIDHVHADAICAIANQPDGRQLILKALGNDFAFLDWLRPGFELSKLVSELSNYRGVVLAHHGLITWAEDSETCYQRTLEAVGVATAFAASSQLRREPANQHADYPDDQLNDLLVTVRGSLSSGNRRILRVDERLRTIADRPDLDDVLAAGVSSADHMLHIKPRSVAVSDLDSARLKVREYVANYEAYVTRNTYDEVVPAHESDPRVVLVPGLGAITTGRSRLEAKVAADVSLHSHGTATKSIDAFSSSPVSLSDEETYGFDFWELERYKLSLIPPPLPLVGRIVVITGAASGIGRGVALHLASQGAATVLADMDRDGLEEVAELAGRHGVEEPAITVGDQTDPAAVAMTIRTAIRRFGGVDGAVLNAGIGMTGSLTDLTADQWNRAINVNLTSAFLLTQALMKVMDTQGTGGSLVYIASKNAFSPGAGFGAYSVSKAGMIQLMRIAALEGGRFGMRSNAINPDAVFDNSRLWEGGIREERAAAHGVLPEELEDFYAARNLLNRRVTSLDIAQAAEFLLSDQSSRTTGAVIPVDGGVAAAFPR